ncbi:helix-turn-helix domain-containing protein [Streptomyces albulus]|nr:helix-turn-helix domain-containing protein [Streptomyces noursei]
MADHTTNWPPPRKRLTPQEQARVTAKYKTMYADGTSIRRIAAMSGRSYGFVHRCLADADVMFRSRGGKAR